MNAPSIPQPTHTQRGPVRVYESPAYREARLRAERAAIVAALAEGRTAREVMAELDAAEAAEEQGDE